MTFHLYLKSHTDAPDFEDTVEAASWDEAIAYFLSKYDLDRQMIVDNMEEEEAFKAYLNDMARDVN